MMRALTLHQPWAWAIAHADKAIENRQKVPPLALIGHDFAVHAGLTLDEVAWADFRDGLYGDAAQLVPDTEHLVRGAVVAVARLDDYRRVMRAWPLGRDIEADRRWFTGAVGNILSDRRPLRTPVPCRGMQGWWPLPPDVEAAVRAQLAEAG